MELMMQIELNAVFTPCCLHQSLHTSQHVGVWFEWTAEGLACLFKSIKPHQKVSEKHFQTKITGRLREVKYEKNK